MFVYGINLPVVEILFVTLVLVIIALAFIIIQLRAMAHHLNILDAKNLQIRRTEEEAERKVERYAPRQWDAAARRAFSAQFFPRARNLERWAAERLLSGDSGEQVRDALVLRGVLDRVATRIVNNAIGLMRQYESFSTEEARAETTRMVSAMRRESA
jgi:hypothetical protein